MFKHRELEQKGKKDSPAVVLEFLMKNQPMKYYRLAEHHIVRKYDIRKYELSMLLELFYIGRFPLSEIFEVGGGVSWDPQRRKRWKEKYVEVKSAFKDGDVCDSYGLNYKSREIVREFYRCLSDITHIPKYKKTKGGMITKNSHLNLYKNIRNKQKRELNG